MARRDNSFRGSLVLLRALCVSLLCASSDATWAPRRATAWVHASDDALRTPLPRLRLQGVPRRLLLSESESPSDEFEESDAEAAPPSLLGGGLFKPLVTALTTAFSPISHEGHESNQTLPELNATIDLPPRPEGMDVAQYWVRTTMATYLQAVWQQVTSSSPREPYGVIVSDINVASAEI
jgi:hypothetical protein